MIIPDINLLLYAHFEAYAVHKPARRWWQDALTAGDELAIPHVVLFGFLRLATSRRVYVQPFSIEEAICIAKSWFKQPHVRLLIPGHRYLDIAFGLLSRLGTAGNLTTDVQIAAFALEYQAEVFSNDTDFGKFPGLRWSNPLA